MSLIPVIQLHHVSYTIQGQQSPLLQNISMTFSGSEKIGLVGPNGVGKSTLLKLITGQLRPSNGDIQCQGEIIFLPQHFRLEAQATVAEVLGISKKLASLKRITRGSVDERDYEVLNDDWTVADRTMSHLTKFGLGHLTWQQRICQLSGGEQTRLHLCKIFMCEADFLLLDEPTNNLDQTAREIVYQNMAEFSGGMIIASHDRELLRQVDKIIELSSLGARVYGGDFDEYKKQKQIHQRAIEHKLQSEIQQLQKAKITVQGRLEKHQRNEAKGHREKKAQLTAKGRINKIEINSARGRSERTIRRIKNQANRKLQTIERDLTMTRQNIESHRELNIDLNHSGCSKRKVLIDCQKVSFHYQVEQPLLENLDLVVSNTDRIAVVGANGSGKTTLVKLIMNELQPTAGCIIRRMEHFAYLDQHTSLLENKMTVLENFIKFNPQLTEFECRHRLAQFLFRNKSAESAVSSLSDGERIRALLAAMLMGANPPELIILDEPTNHLDIDSITILEQAFQNYQGALLVISHDDDFLQNINIDRKIYTPLKYES